MLCYAILTEDVPDSLPRRLAARPAHLARLQTLRDEGRLLLAGPHPAADCEDPGVAGFSGSLVVARFDDLASAEAWAADDPYVHAGVYA
ncbi:MAG TPA: YciI family protein, partial [Pseudomonadales bacterium]|nr:YciI family protein [Pseudomonadales bacterium]